MIRLLAGYKTQNISEIPTVIHVGDNGAVLQKVASEQGGKGFVRMRWFQLDNGIPVPMPTALVEPEPPKEETKLTVEGATEQPVLVPVTSDDEQAKKDAEKAAKKAEAKAKKDAEKAAKNQTS